MLRRPALHPLTPAAAQHAVAVKHHAITLTPAWHAGETVATNNTIRDILFSTIYGMISESAQNNGPAQGSNFWNLYTVGIAQDDPFRVTLDDSSTMVINKQHVCIPGCSAFL